jgi:hypothetical protein
LEKAAEYYGCAAFQGHRRTSIVTAVACKMEPRFLEIWREPPNSTNRPPIRIVRRGSPDMAFAWNKESGWAGIWRKQRISYELAANQGENGARQRLRNLAQCARTEK